MITDAICDICQDKKVHIVVWADEGAYLLCKRCAKDQPDIIARGLDNAAPAPSQTLLNKTLDETSIKIAALCGHKFEPRGGEN